MERLGLRKSGVLSSHLLEMRLDRVSLQLLEQGLLLGQDPRRSGILRHEYRCGGAKVRAYSLGMGPLRAVSSKAMSSL